MTKMNVRGEVNQDWTKTLVHSGWDWRLLVTVSDCIKDFLVHDPGLNGSKGVLKFPDTDLRPPPPLFSPVQ